MKKMPNTSPALRTWAARDGEWAQYLSDAFAFGGDSEKAFEWLDLARKAGFFNHMYLAQHDPFIAHLRDNPEWTRLLDGVRSHIGTSKPNSSRFRWLLRINFEVHTD